MTNEELAEKLRIIATSTYSKDIHGAGGLCDLLGLDNTYFLSTDYDQYALIKKSMLKWSLKYGSGCDTVPVPSFSKLLNKNCKFMQTTGKQKWDRRTKYGKSRRHMCSFIADAIEAECPGEGLCTSPGCPVHYSD